MRRGEGQRLATVVFLLVVGFSLVMLGKRLILLWPLLAAGLAFSTYVRKVRMSAAPPLLAGAVTLGMLTLMFRIFAPARVAGIQINLDSIPYARGSVTRFYFNSLEFSTVEMLSLSMQSSDAILGRFDSRFAAFWRTILEPAFFAVPRAVWPSKPTSFTDMAYAVSGVLTGRPLDEAEVGYAVTYVGVAFILGGLTAVLLTSVALGLCAAALDRRRSRMLRTDAGVIWFALLLVLLFHAFRHGSIGSAIVIGVAQNYGFVIASIGLTFLARAKSPTKGRDRV